MKPVREVIEVNFEELDGLLERARQGPLGEEDHGKLQVAIHALSHLIEMIGEKDTTISQLRALLVKPSTEKTSKVLEQAGLKTSPKSSCPPPPGTSANEGEKPKPGHGRNGAAAYRGAERIKISHPYLKPGDRCPACLKGRVHPPKDPGLKIRVKGQAPLTATGRIEAVEGRLGAMLDAIKTVRGPLEKFYDSLSDEQRVRFNRMGPPNRRTG